MVTVYRRGFTVVELMVALAILATIMSLAVPRYFQNLDTAKENVLRENLYVLRDAIDKHFSDHDRYPDTLEDLVTKRYLRAIPVDPLTKSSRSWVVQTPPDRAEGGVFDVRSGAPNQARDGTWFKDW
jgi:general secretion pathway protein G